jgi:hypothetical protein
MLSVILYGRNDSHGYNLHKRAAISLNSIAEVLTAPGDEILFVDYNTPNYLPTFIEAIYDTLTPRAKSLLRVFRVRPALHARLVKHTHLFALEPHSRNIAIRRSNPQNRWVLFTNTDMIFVPRAGHSASISDAVRDLADGQYILPRFELPEPLWESFPRTDPAEIMRACEDLGWKLHLNEIAIAHPYMRFDSPGDFQLVPRRALFEINGFDERMIHGWHADSNMCKRFFLFYGGRTESLASRLKGYHCDHTRVATLAHRLDIKLENDLQEFVYGVEDPVARHQADTWGAPSEQIEEVDFENGAQARFVAALETALGPAQRTDYHSDANDLRNFVYYQPEHVLPYLAGNFPLFPKTAQFVYVGNNPRMLTLTARCIAQMEFAHPLRYVAEFVSAGISVPDAEPIRTALAKHLLENADALIFDFGLDANGIELGKVTRVTEWPRELRWSLGAIAKCLEDCAVESQEHRGGGGGGDIPDFIVLNANHWVFRQFVGQFLLATDTPYNTHVRKGRPRVGHERLYRSHSWKYTEECMRSYFGYGTQNLCTGTVGDEQTIDLCSLGQSAAYKDGDWGLMDLTGTWTDGPRASILFRRPEGSGDDLVAYVRITEAFLNIENEPIRVGVLLEGEPLARWVFRTRYGIASCKVVLPARLMGKNTCRLTFHIENPQSTQLQATLKGEQTIGEDPRELGVKIQRITFTGTNRLRYTLCDVLDFRDKGHGMFHINECWTQPDDLGTWTLGNDASLVLYLNEPVETPVMASFLVTDVAVSEEHPHLTISVAFNGRSVADWHLGPSRLYDERKVFVPLEVLRAQSPLNISFHVDAPRTPDELNWSKGDTRPLGFRLTRFRLDPVRVPKYKLGEVIDFTSGGSAFSYLGPQWTPPDQYGSWTLGPEAILKVGFQAPPVADVPACFVISDCMVAPSAPNLPVQVRANDEVVADWTFGPTRVPHCRSFRVPAELVRTAKDLTLSFRIPTPRTPAELGWSGDSRPLGIRIAKVMFGEGEIEIPVFRGPEPDSAWIGERLRSTVITTLRGLRAAAKGAS